MAGNAGLAFDQYVFGSRGMNDHLSIIVYRELLDFVEQMVACDFDIISHCKTRSRQFEDGRRTATGGLSK